MAGLLTSIIADVSPAKGFSPKNRIFNFLLLISIGGLVITTAMVILAIGGFVDFRFAMAGGLLFLLAVVALFMIALFSKNDQDAQWVFEHQAKIQAAGKLIQMPDDWSIQKRDPALIASGSAGIFVIFDRADLEGQNLADSKTELQETILAVCQWTQARVKKATLNVIPSIIILHDFPQDKQYNFLPFPYRILKPSDLDAYFGKFPKVLDSIELERFHVTAFEGSTGPRTEPRPAQGRFERRAKSKSISRSRNRSSSKLAKVALVLMIIGGVFFGAYQFKPMYFQQAWYIAKYWVGETAPEIAKTLRLPISEEFSVTTIRGYAKGVVNVFPRVGGGDPQGRFQSGEKLDILERDYDSLQEPWLYVQNSQLDGWIKQDQIAFDYLKAGTNIYTESDLNVGKLSVLSHDIPAVAVRHRYRSGVKDSGWWEFLAPGLQKFWVMSDINPLINPGGGN